MTIQYNLFCDKYKLYNKYCYAVIAIHFFFQTAPIVKHMVGLRPSRSEIRLGIETKDIGNKQMKIVHNYGHGGCGVTLCVGCAVEAAELVEIALNGNKSKL